MIFPELPRRQYFWTQQQHDYIFEQSNTQQEDTTTVKTPLREVEETARTGTVDVEQWFIKHGLATDPAAGSYAARTNEPLDWFARDAWELYGLITVFAVWLSFWLGIHRGWW